MPSGLDRVREVARRDKDARFTALLHHVGLDRLWAAYVAINPKAAPGAGQVTRDAYGQDLRENLEDLLRRVRSGAYRTSPSRRVYIPKPDGRQRPPGVATLEDKIIQRAVAGVLNAVYEADFRGFSYYRTSTRTAARRSTTTGAWAATTTGTKAAGSAATSRSGPITSTPSCGSTPPACSPTSPHRSSLAARGRTSCGSTPPACSPTRP